MGRSKKDLVARRAAIISFLKDNGSSTAVQVHESVQDTLWPDPVTKHACENSLKKLAEEGLVSITSRRERLPGMAESFKSGAGARKTRQLNVNYYKLTKKGVCGE